MVISVVAIPKPSIATATMATATMATAIVALPSATMIAITTLTTMVAIAFSGMASGSGYMVPTTIPTTIAGGCVNGPLLPGTHIGGVAITTA